MCGLASTVMLECIEPGPPSEQALVQTMHICKRTLGQSFAWCWNLISWAHTRTQGPMTVLMSSDWGPSTPVQVGVVTSGVLPL